MEEEVRHAFLLPHDFERRVSESPLAYVPVGSLEYHSDHLAIGNDSIKMEALCVDAARISGGVVFPVIYTAGTGGVTLFPRRYRFEGGLPLPTDLVQQLLLTVLERLEKSGFKAAILITGHTSTGQMALMKEVAREYKRRGKMLVVGTSDYAFAHSMSHFSDHAGKWETSLLWHYRPELVDMTRLPRDLSVRPDAVGGDDPRVHASPELGHKVARQIALELARLGQRTLKRTFKLQPGKPGRLAFSVAMPKAPGRSLKVRPLSRGRPALASEFRLFGEETGKACAQTRVELAYDKDALNATFLADRPGLSGADKSSRKLASRECFEIFLASDPLEPRRFVHIGFNPLGEVQFREGSKFEKFRAFGKAEKDRWVTRAIVMASDIGIDRFRPGMTILANFCRSGLELSSWGKCISTFHEAEAFGRLTFVR